LRVINTILPFDPARGESTAPAAGRTWWGEAVVAKVRLHVPVDYFRVGDDAGTIEIGLLDHLIPRK
jgi:hypothetical protein